MFERYTERARRVLFFGRYEASQLGSISIETEHLLLGLIREGKGLTSRIFARSHLSLETIRKEIEARTVFREKVPTSVEIPFSAESKRVLLFAAEEADRLLHNYIGTEHLLLGVLREERSVAAAILMEKGMRLAAVREDIVQLLQQQSATPFQEEGFAETIEPGSESSSFLDIRIAPVTGSGSSTSGRPGSWVAACDLRSLLSRICDCPMARIELPSPLDKGERYSFSIRYSPDQQDAVRNRLLLAWVEAHFRITVTREARPMEVYVLTAPDGLSPSVKALSGEGAGGVSTFGSMEFSAGGGSELPSLEAAGGRVPPLDVLMKAGLIASIGNISAPGTVAEFGQLLEHGLDRFVVDETGLTGRYDFQVSGEARSTDEFRQKLRDQLGLLLTPANRDVAMLVVRIDQATSHTIE